MSKLITLVLSLILSSMTNAHDGMISIKSNHSVKETSTKLINTLKDKGMTVFDVIDHQKGAEKAEVSLRPTTLVIFGNPKVGTPLMQCDQHVAIDLPQKALIWQDESGQVWYSYNDPEYLSRRHDLSNCQNTIKKITKALTNFANAATH